jgi:hypothetical protein
MKLNNLTAIAFGIAALSAVALNAQSQESKVTTTTKVEIKNGKTVTVRGCLSRRANGDYMLSDARENMSQAATEYSIVTDDNLSKDVGHRVEIKGKTVGNHDGKVKVETKTKVDVEDGKDTENKSKTEGTTGLFDAAYLGVNSMKMLSSSCEK